MLKTRVFCNFWNSIFYKFILYRELHKHKAEMSKTQAAVLDWKQKRLDMSQSAQWPRKCISINFRFYFLFYVWKSLLDLSSVQYENRSTLNVVGPPGTKKYFWKFWFFWTFGIFLNIFSTIGHWASCSQVESRWGSQTPCWCSEKEQSAESHL